MPARPRLIFLLNSAHRRLQQWMATQQANADSQALLTPTPAQGGVLFVLNKTDGATMGELALVLDLGPPAVSGLVQRMEALDWVQRRPCPQDARTQRVWLRPAGRELVPALHQALARINERVTAGFSDTELQVVARWLRHVQQLDNTTF